MPVTHSQSIVNIGRTEFKQLDYKVMGHAFEIHNDLGCLFDEKIYASKLEASLRCEGFSVEREFELKVSHKGFQKSYYIDLLVENSIPYELKSVEHLGDHHLAQTLNYLFLTNLQHGKLLNFGSPSVEGRFIDTSIGAEQRRQFSIKTSNANCSQAKEISQIINDLLDDLGTHLAAKLYWDALTTLIPSAEMTPTKLTSDTTILGQLELCRLQNDSFLYVSAQTKGYSAIRKHLFHILQLAQLKRAHWVNFDRSDVTIEVIDQT